MRRVLLPCKARALEQQKVSILGRRHLCTTSCDHKSPLWGVFGGFVVPVYTGGAEVGLGSTIIEKTKTLPRLQFERSIFVGDLALA